MKTRRLSEIDLARLASLTDQVVLEQALRAYNTGGGSWSYDPVRTSTSEILGAATPLLGKLPRLPWSKLERQISSACRRGHAQVKANVQVGKILFEATNREGWSAAKFSMGHLPIGIGESVRYWSDVVLEDEGGLIVPFFDHRREHGIANAAIRQIVFSMQHLWIRERHLDLATARLAVIRFPTNGKARSIQITHHSDVDLLPYDELDARVRNVYETWGRISAVKAQENRKAANDRGSLFG